MIFYFLLPAGHASACSPPLAANSRYFCCRVGGEGKKKALERAQELEQRGIKNQLLERLIVLFDPQSWELSFLGHTGRGKAPNSRLCISLPFICSRLGAPSPAWDPERGSGLRVEGYEKGGQEQLRAGGVNI